MFEFITVKLILQTLRSKVLNFENSAKIIQAFIWYYVMISYKCCSSLKTSKCPIHCYNSWCLHQKGEQKMMC